METVDTMAKDDVSQPAPASSGIESFDAVKQRLEAIAEAVGDESLSLDEALDLYEEAITLGLKASDLLDLGIEIEEESENPDGAEEALNDAAVTAASSVAGTVEVQDSPEQ